MMAEKHEAHMNKLRSDFEASVLNGQEHLSVGG